MAMHSLQVNQSFTPLSRRISQTYNNTGRKCSHLKNCISMQRRRVVATGKIEGVNSGVEKDSCVVVGGGPAGLGTAIMLAQKGWKKITVLEQLSEYQITDATKSLQYGIHGRGQQFLEKIGANEEIKRTGLFLSETTGYSQVKPDGKIILLGSFSDISSKNFPSYLCLRSTVLEVLHAKIKNLYQDVIKIKFNTTCIDMQKDYSKIKLIYQSKSQNLIEIQPQLIVGCDGKNSLIRQKLHEISKNKQFHLNQIQLPISGRRFKILQVPSNFYFYKNSQQHVKNDIMMTYYIEGNNTNEKQKLLLCKLPPSKSLQEKNVSIMSVQTPQNGHILWTLDTAEKLFDYLEREFPQLNFREMLSSGQAEQFVKSKGVQHPKGGYSSNASYTCHTFNLITPNTPTLQGNNNNNKNNNNNLHQGVVLIGDSLHHFTPTYGLGVNSAFEDILVLIEQLEKYNDNFVQALQKYDQLRVVDSKALVEIQQTPIVNPQDFYNLFKQFLNKKLSKICPPQDATYILDENLRFSEVQFRIRMSNFIYSLYLGVSVFLAVLILNGAYNLFGRTLF